MCGTIDGEGVSYAIQAMGRVCCDMVCANTLCVCGQLSESGPIALCLHCSLSVCWLNDNHGRLCDAHMRMLVCMHMYVCMCIMYMYVFV